MFQVQVLTYRPCFTFFPDLSDRLDKKGNQTCLAGRQEIKHGMIAPRIRAGQRLPIA
jgi:hypothetical protein